MPQEYTDPFFGEITEALPIYGPLLTWFLIRLGPGLPQNMDCGARLNTVEVKGLVIFKLPATVYQI